METKNKVDFLIKSAIEVQFISKYCKLEKTVLSIFKSEILKVDSIYKNKLFFYYGIYAGHNVGFDFEKNCTSLSCNVYFDEDKMFSSLNLNKIIKFEKREALIQALNFNVNSVIRKSCCFPFYECCLRLMSMRNKLAHELDTLSFNEKDIVEVLSCDYLKQHNYNCMEGLEFDLSDDGIVALLSNIVYLNSINEKLQKTIESQLNSGGVQRS